MPKALSLTLKVLLSIVLLLVVLVVALVFLVNPNQYKPALQQAVLSNTGYELNIAGDISLSFRPYIGVNLNDVRVRNPAYPQELASTSSVSLKVDLGQLIRGNLYIEEFSAEDFHANWLTNADGSNIWQIAPADLQALEPEPTDSSSSTISAAFRQITINNASIDIQDVAAGYRYSIADLNLTSSDSNLENRPFPLQAEFAVTDHSADQTYQLNLASTIAYDSQAGNAELTQIRLNLTPLLLQGQIIVAGLNDEPVWNGNIQSNTVVVSELLAALGVSEPAQQALTAPSINADPGQQLSFAVQFAGDSSQISVPVFTANLGDAEINAELNVRMASAIAPLNVSYQVSTGPLDLTPFMGADTTAEPVAGAEPVVTTNSPGTAVASANNDDTEIPKDLLTSMNVLGTISIESVTAGNFQTGAINLLTNLEDGLLDIEAQPIATLGGQLSGNLHLNANGATATGESVLNMRGINITELAQSIPQLETIQGIIDIDNSYKAQGNTVNEMLASLNGASSFAIAENAVDVTIIKQVFTSIAALSPYGAIGQNWPDVIQFDSIGGFLQMPNGLEGQQALRLVMDNFDMLGSGSINMVNGTFDYDFAFTMLGEPNTQTIPINERYRDISWPVTCAAAFAAEVSQYCRPNFTQVRELLVQMGTNAVQSELQDRLDEELEDNVPEELRDTARGLLRNIFDRDN